jgi:hypothetical protein
MIKYFCLNLLLLLSIGVSAQNIPEQFIEYVNENFNRRTNLQKYSIDPKNGYELTQRKSGDYSYRFAAADSASKSIFRIDSFMLGDFVLFIDLNLSSQNCQPVFGLNFTKRDGNYYQLKLKNENDILRLNLDIVKDSSCIQIESVEIDNSFLGDNPWTKFALSRNIIDGSLDIYLHTSKSPIIEITDRQLILGSLEMYSESCPIQIDNLKIYAPTFVKEYK